MSTVQNNASFAEGINTFQGLATVTSSRVIAHNFGHYTARVTDFQLKTMRDGNKAFTVHAEILESSSLRANEARQFGEQVMGTQLSPGEHGVWMTTTRNGDRFFNILMAAFINGSTGLNLEGADLVEFAEQNVSVNGSTPMSDKFIGSEFKCMVSPRATRNGYLGTYYKFV